MHDVVIDYVGNPTRSKYLELQNENLLLNYNLWNKNCHLLLKEKYEKRQYSAVPLLFFFFKIPDLIDTQKRQLFATCFNFENVLCRRRFSVLPFVSSTSTPWRRPSRLLTGMLNFPVTGCGASIKIFILCRNII